MSGALCAVFSCKHSRASRKDTESNIEFHTFPREPELKEKWIKFCQRIGKWNPNNSKICSVHFREDDFERNIEYELLGIEKRGCLKKTAVPSLNAPKGVKQHRSTEQFAIEKQNKGEKVIEAGNNRRKLPSRRSTSRVHNGNQCHLNVVQIIKQDNSNVEIEVVKEQHEPQKYKNLKIEEKNLSEVNYDYPTFKNKNLSVRLVPVDSLEAKYNDLCKENQFLKEQLTKIGSSSKSTFIVDSGGKKIEANHIIDLTDIHSVCRICLKKTADLVSVYETITFESENFPDMTIVQALESTTSDTVEIADNIPSQICTLCKDQLILFVIFKYAYKKATTILQLYANGEFGNTNKKFVPDDHDYPKENPSDSDESFKVKSEMLDASENSDSDTDAQDDPPHDDSKKLAIPDSVIVPRPSNRKRITKPVHTCPICWIKMPFSEFISHVKSHRTLEKYLSGPKVSRITRFYVPPRDVKGLMSGGNEKIHACPVCNGRFKATEFMLHVDHHISNDSFNCEKCKRIFKKKSYLLSHMLVHAKDFPFRCATCNKGFVRKDNYEYHLLTHKDEELPYKCTDCEKSFSNPKHLSRHKTIHTENRSYSTKYKYKICKHCSQGFATKTLLLNHACPRPGVFGCKYCYKVFTNPRARQLHVRKAHVKGQKKTGFCKDCNATVHNIGYHRLIKHRPERKRALCTVCGLYVPDIYKHMLTHNINRKPFKCPICSKDFTNNYILKKHLHVHSGMKSYVCSYCGKAFNYSYNLQVHERIHVGNRCHKCTVCGQTFLEKSYLNKHMKIHNRDLNETSSDADSVYEIKTETIDEECEYVSSS